MDIGLAGDGPAVDAVAAALDDVDVDVLPVEPSFFDGLDLAVVVDTAGSPAFDAANDRLDRWLAVEVGGVGATPLEAVDASVTLFEDACYDCLCTRVTSGDAEPVAEPTIPAVIPEAVAAVLFPTPLRPTPRAISPPIRPKVRSFFFGTILKHPTL